MFAWCVTLVSPLSKDQRPLEVYSTDFLIDGAQLGVLGKHGRLLNRLPGLFNSILLFF